MSEELNKTEHEEEMQYIVIKLGEESYGIQIGLVDNIVRMQKITRCLLYTSYALLPYSGNC